jgi:hypothetical protein
VSDFTSRCEVTYYTSWFIQINLTLLNFFVYLSRLIILSILPFNLFRSSFLYPLIFLFCFFLFIIFGTPCRDTSVGTGADYGLAGKGSIPGSAHADPGPHPTSYPKGTVGSFRGGKWPVREADHSPPTSAEVKNCGAIPPFLYTSSWGEAEVMKPTRHSSGG